MKKVLLIPVIAGCLVGMNPDHLHAAAFTAGNLVVDRIGDGIITPLTSAATPVFLDEFTTVGGLVQSVAMPTTVSGSNRQLTDTGTGTSAGYITRSVDGQYILVAGYDAAVGTLAVASTPNPGTARVIGRVDSLGNIDTTTALSDSSYNGENFRSVASIDGTQFWTTGSGSAGNPGIRYVSSLGASTSSQLSASPNNGRVVSIQGGQLFASAMIGAFRGVNSVGSGIPTTSGQTTTLAPGFSPLTTSPQSAYGFVFADATAANFLGTGFDTLWVADDRTASPGGIERWTFDGSTWTMTASLLLGTSGNLGARGLIGTFDPGTLTMTLFATTTQTTANQIITLTDVFDGTSTWAFGPTTSIATAPANEVFRGIAFAPEVVPEPQGLLLLGAAAFGLVAWRRRTARD